ncbi:MAG: MarR family winged helix-turn-helix transcriptional regulator [Pseudomonadota bacterium]
MTKATNGARPGAGENGADGNDGEVSIDRLMRAMEVFRELDPDMPIQYALSFLTLARNPGLSIRDLSERLGIAQSSASRNVAALSEWHSFRKPGHNLVQAKEDPRERRRKIVSLTRKGKALLVRLEAVMDGGDGAETEVTRLSPSGAPAKSRRLAASS